jgi:hypothetical protein
MLDKVAFDGTVDSVSTNHGKYRTAIKVSAKLSELGETESQSLGNYHKIKTPVKVRVFVTDAEYVEFTATLGAISTNWNEEFTSVSMSVHTEGIEFERTTRILGMWAAKEIKVGFIFESAQKELL